LCNLWIRGNPQNNSWVAGSGERDQRVFKPIRASVILRAVRNHLEFILATLSLGLFTFLSISCGKLYQTQIESIKTTKLSTATSLSADSDDDGIPDAAELSAFADRENFRRWFTSIAEMQFYKLSDSWNIQQRDCAGLVRFAWREALRRHDRQWFKAMGEGFEAIAPDVKAYTLDHGKLGERLFRTDYGAFAENDLSNGKFSEFADARTLKNHNVKFISRKRAPHIQAGDLLFFHQPWTQKFPYHVMIFIGQSRHAAEGADDWVVYHTGASPLDVDHSGGEVKLVRLAVLEQHPAMRWRPIESNRNFLGFFRLKILE
jgi:uncharacterized protein YfaT (DUF1175 family)